MRSPSPASSCVKCGGNTVRMRCRPGRTIAHRTIPALPTPADFLIPTCSRCRAEYVDAETTAALLLVLEREYQRELSRRVRAAIDALNPCISQRRLELLLGLSQGYLSKLRAGVGKPSPQLVAHLTLLARDPATRLMETWRYWAEPATSPDSSNSNTRTASEPEDPGQS